MQFQQYYGQPYQAQPQQPQCMMSPATQQKLQKVQTLFPQANQYEQAMLLQNNLGPKGQQCRPQPQCQMNQQYSIPQYYNQQNLQQGMQYHQTSQPEPTRIELTVSPSDISAPEHPWPNLQTVNQKPVQENNEPQVNNNVYLPKQLENNLEMPKMPLEAPKLPMFE